jgi:FtsZ-interacting cell division protein ZipA
MRRRENLIIVGVIAIPIILIVLSNTKMKDRKKKEETTMREAKRPSRDLGKNIGDENSCNKNPNDRYNPYGFFDDRYIG